MATESTTNLYPLDLTGSSSDNLVDGERQAVNAPDREDYYFLIPKAAPFFADSLELFIDDTNVELQEGVDYAIGHYFIEAMESTGSRIAGSIRLFDYTFNGILRLKYQTLGGQWGFSDTALLEELSNKHYNPLTRTWGQVDVLPASFPPTPHDQRLDSLVGASDLKTVLDQILAAVIEANEGASEEHINDRNNPHGVTKTQVDLGNVQNYPVATPQQARDGLSNEVYMTAQMTMELVSAQVKDAFEAHLNDFDAPHRPTKDQVGLGSVPNQRNATAEEHVAGVADNLFATPAGVKAFFDAQDFGGADDVLTALEAHKNNRNNPHGTKAADVGSYSTEEVDDLLANITAENTSRFAGMTEEEWRDSLPSAEDITALTDGMRNEYSSAGASVGNVTAPPNVAPTQPMVSEVVVSRGGYLVAWDDGTYQGYPLSLPNQDLYQTDPATVSVRFVDGAVAGYYIDAEGYIHPIGNVPAPPASLGPDATVPPSPRPTVISTTPYRTYVLMDDESMVAWSTDSDSQTITPTGVRDVMAADGTDVTQEWTLLLDSDGNLTADGETAFVDEVTALVASLDLTTVEIETALVGYGVVVMLFSDATVRAWRFPTEAGATLSLTEETLPPELSSGIAGISGFYKHIGFVTDTGLFYTWDVEDRAGPWLHDGAISDVSTADMGDDYTVVLYATGYLEYRGGASDNRYLPLTQ